MKHNILWHPHQKLWNSRLIRFINKSKLPRIVRLKLIKLVIFIDTFLLGVRLKLFHNPKVQRNNYARHINYFDIGLHKEASELRWVLDTVLQQQDCSFTAYGFEANPDSYEQARQCVPQANNIRLYNYAIINEQPPSGTIKLYISKKGLSDSIYRDNFGEHIEVPAIKFSDFIQKENIDLVNSINVLRMNIEGAEYDVIQDLINSKLLQYFDRLYGMWDDVSKTDHSKDLHFRMIMKKHNIHQVPLNGRDLRIQSRLGIIKKDFFSVISRCHETKLD